MVHHLNVYIGAGFCVSLCAHYEVAGIHSITDDSNRAFKIIRNVDNHQFLYRIDYYSAHPSNRPKASLRNEAPVSIGSAIAWIIGGFFLSLFAQSIAGTIEQYAFGIGRESENTQTILSIMDAVPWLVIVIALIGPILEEIIFRKIIFGVIYEKRIFHWSTCQFSGFCCCTL